MHALINSINELKSGEIGERIAQRMRGFKEIFKSKKHVFSELCFCILTANSSAEMGIKVQQNLNGDFERGSRKKLSKKLRKIGYRFYNKRAEYIFEARAWLDVRDRIRSFENEAIAREWLASNVKGLGYKESSHFLRNIGFSNLAILDRHILRIMYERGLIDKLPDSALNKTRYCDYEKRLEPLCKATALTQGELDMYLWYIKTGKVLK